MKRVSIPIALAALVFCAQANAIPISWSLAGDHANGGFFYDADTNAYSDISVSTAAVTYEDLVFGNSTNLDLEGGLFNCCFLNLDFAAPLTNAGGSIAYTSAAGIGGFVTSHGDGTATGDGATAVPEPGALALLGGGLLGLAWFRRRRA